MRGMKRRRSRGSGPPARGGRKMWAAGRMRRAMRVADLLFDREKGAGLSMYRYNIGGGNGDDMRIADPWRRAASFEVAPRKYDWTRDANARWMLRAARDRGVEQFIAFVNSPPARMTLSGQTTGGHDGESNLPLAMHDAFAQYLVDVVRHLRDEEGVPVRWLSPINEPQWNWSSKNGQEGCHYEPDEVRDLARILLHTLHQNQLDVQLSLFESGEWKASLPYVEALAGDPQVWSALPHLAIHSYWSTREDKARFVADMRRRHLDKPIWMSEWTEMREGRDVGMELGPVDGCHDSRRSDDRRRHIVAVLDCRFKISIP